MTDKSQEMPDILGAIIVVLLVFVAGHLIFALIAAIDAANTVNHLPSHLVRIDRIGKDRGFLALPQIQYGISLLFALCSGFGYFIAAQKPGRSFWRRVPWAIWYGTITVAGLSAVAAAVAGALYLIVMMMFGRGDR
jgi:hypothetical protein